ncbi:MAG: MFS transporter [Eubacterium sp.]|nr:MFS transporter [Eubacterium sp.]
MADIDIKQKAVELLDSVRYFWKEPPKGRYMSFKEIASYAFGGIGFYFIVCMSISCILAATNVFISGTIGIGMTDMYILYVIGVLSGIPLTAIRANIIDNTRNKEGKYRPYILSMGIPSVILFVGMVWFPYNILEDIFGTSLVFGKPAYYVAKCAVVMLFNIGMQFFYYFFYDSYENLIHVLSPNSQERADVVSIKSVIYSFGPSLFNMIMPIIAQNIFHTNQTDIRVYRLAFPIIGVIGLLMCVIIYANTQEKIIQAKTHVVQIKFMDALRAVAKNKYFWIISLAVWIGFLENAYSNILYWLYNYGGAASGNVYMIIVTLNGNAALWGMILAPFFIRKWGKKKVQIVTNLLNILFIILMLPIVSGGTDATGNLKPFIIWGVLACLYCNGIVGSFAHILNPSIQADIRDYQQYQSGERIDGMFSAVTAIGNVIMLVTAGVLPALQERYGMTMANAKNVVGNSALMSRILPGTNQTIGQMLTEQAANGQDLYNPSNALYDVGGTLVPLLRILVVVAAIGALMNVIPFFFYDLTEDKQKSIIRVLKVRALFEDYGNNALKDRELVEAIDLVNDAREMASATPKTVDKNGYKAISDKAERKAAKKAYKEALEFNEEIEISKFVCAELDKFNSPVVQKQLALYKAVYEQGLEGIRNTDVNAVKQELAEAKRLPKSTAEEKEFRKISIELAKKKLSSYNNYVKHFGTVKEFAEPDIATLEDFFNIEDKCDEIISSLTKELSIAKKDKAEDKIADLKQQIKHTSQKRKEAREASKKEMDTHAVFNRAADVYITARKLLIQQENFSHFDEIAALYDEAKKKADEEDRIKKLENEKKRAEEQAELAKRKAEKAAKKNK